MSRSKRLFVIANQLKPTVSLCPAAKILSPELALDLLIGVPHFFPNRSHMPSSFLLVPCKLTLLLLGVLVMRSGLLPRILDVWLVINGFAFVGLTGRLRPQFRY
jgi:hypothetical protein